MDANINQGNGEIRRDVIPNEQRTPRAEQLKFLIIGDYGVGKTAIVRRYVDGIFTSKYKVTIGADFTMKSVIWEGKTPINIQLWDIAGHERFGFMTRVYYKYAVGAAVVYDLSRAETTKSISKWLDDMREKVTLPDGSPVPVVLLANKCDVIDTVPNDVIKRLGRLHNCDAWFPTSAKENINIDNAFNFLITRALQVKAQDPISKESIILGYKNHNYCDKNKEKSRKEKCC